MTLALPTPTCDANGNYKPQQCKMRKIQVTQTEAKRLLEEKNVRQMKSLLANSRQKRAANNQMTTVELVPLQQATESLRSLQDLNIRNLVEFLRQKILDPITNRDEVSFAEMILHRDADVQEGRSAKVIDFSSAKSQSLVAENGLFDKPLKRTYNANRRTVMQDEPNKLVDVEVESCWCVDSFGTEIPNSRGANTTDESCQQ